ncbi:MAG: serine/threonine protein phosphatase [Planctomycetia bacterium 21-64-5]|nr:MAG: serine/threonine protein phosphatase [Planctomycetia bacterium 21-64-5]
MALRALLEAIDPQPDDTIVTLGDYVDRGPDTKGTLDELIALAARCRLVPVLGNHDEMLLYARGRKDDLRFWLECGGQATLDSYGQNARTDAVPSEHWDFLRCCRRFFETETHFFVHAIYRPELPLDALDDRTLRWLPLHASLPGPHVSGKIAVVGHTPQEDVLDLGHLIDVDTGCCYGGWLTALDLTSGRRWQAAESGQLRE